MNMDKLDALAKSVRDVLRDHPYAKRIEIVASNEEYGLTTYCVVSNKDGSNVRLVRSGEAPF